MLDDKYPLTNFIEGLGELLLKTLGGGDEEGRIPERRGPLGRFWFFLILFLTLVVCGALWVVFWVFQKAADGIVWAMCWLPGAGLVLAVLGAWMLRWLLVRNLLVHGRWENIFFLASVAAGTAFAAFISFGLSWQTGNKALRFNCAVLGVCFVLTTLGLGYGVSHYYGMAG